MANKKSSSSSTTTTKRTITFRGIVNFISYIAVFCIGIALLLQVCLKSNSFSSAFQMVAECLAYVVVSISAFFYARNKRSIWYLICWIVAVILIIVFIILR